MNKVAELMAALLEQNPQYYYRGKFYSLKDPNAPMKPTADFVRSNIKALLDGEKEEQVDGE